MPVCIQSNIQALSVSSSRLFSLIPCSQSLFLPSSYCLLPALPFSFLTPSLSLSNFFLLHSFTPSSLPPSFSLLVPLSIPTPSSLLTSLPPCPLFSSLSLSLLHPIPSSLPPSSCVEGPSLCASAECWLLICPSIETCLKLN